MSPSQKRRAIKHVVEQGLGTTAEASVEWLETVITEAQNAGPITGSALLVRLPSGASIELANASQAGVAAALLRAWEKAPC